jgi:neural Wiskott-Aldrich syndrome protein
VLAVAIVKLYITTTSSWEPTNIIGPVSITNNTEDHSHYIHVVNYADKSIALSQELYENFNYESPKDFFHSFEMDDCVAGRFITFLPLTKFTSF